MQDHIYGEYLVGREPMGCAVALDGITFFGFEGRLGSQLTFVTPLGPSLSLFVQLLALALPHLSILLVHLGDTLVEHLLSTLLSWVSQKLATASTPQEKMTPWE